MHQIPVNMLHNSYLFSLCCLIISHISPPTQNTNLIISHDSFYLRLANFWVARHPCTRNAHKKKCITHSTIHGQPWSNPAPLDQRWKKNRPRMHDKWVGASCRNDVTSRGGHLFGGVCWPRRGVPAKIPPSWSVL